MMFQQRHSQDNTDVPDYQELPQLTSPGSRCICWKEMCLEADQLHDHALVQHHLMIA